MDISERSKVNNLFKNNNCVQNFTKESMDNTLFYSWAVYAADMDGDGDMDVLSANYGSSGNVSTDGRVSWYENDGGENFTEQIISICSNFFDGTFTILEFPVSKPKIREYTKLVGIFDGVI